MIEKRTFNIEENRMESHAELGRVITGHAAVFNQPSEEIFVESGWREIIRPGAFSEAIKRDDVRALFNHESSKIVGRSSNGTLRLSEDDVGLKVQIFPPDTTEARDLLTLIRGKFITQMSFGFSVKSEGQRPDFQNKFREILKVDRLFDVSPVTDPAYTQTDVSVRSLFGELQDKEELKLDRLTDEKQAEFLARMKDRQEFVARRTPSPDPLSLPEIIKSARINK